MKLGNIEEQILDLFLSKLKVLPDLEINLINNISEVDGKQNLLLLVNLGRSKEKRLKISKEYLNMVNLILWGGYYLKKLFHLKKIKLRIKNYV